MALRGTRAGEATLAGSRWGALLATLAVLDADGLLEDLFSIHFLDCVIGITGISEGYEGETVLYDKKLTLFKQNDNFTMIFMYVTLSYYAKN